MAARVPSDEPTVARPPGGAVPALTEAAIRELASIKGQAAPVTSCYLDVDGRRFVRRQDLEHELDTAAPRRQKPVRRRRVGAGRPSEDRPAGAAGDRPFTGAGPRHLRLLGRGPVGGHRAPGAGHEPRRRQPRARGGPARGRAPRARADRRADGRPPAGPHVRLRDGEAGRAVGAVRRGRPRDRQGRARQGRRPGAVAGGPHPGPPAQRRRGRVRGVPGATASSTWPSPRPTTWPPTSRPASTPTCAAACRAA